MTPSQGQTGILQAVGSFQGVSRYHGVMPSRHALAYSDKDIEELVGQGLMEWAKFTYGCGKELKGLRLTPEGERFLEQAGHGEDGQPGSEELAYEHLLILQDLFHFSRMPRYRRMMPEKKARFYQPADFEDLVNRGYILRMKIRAQGEGTQKGYVISGKGERALRQAGLL